MKQFLFLMAATVAQIGTAALIDYDGNNITVDFDAGNAVVERAEGRYAQYVPVGRTDARGRFIDMHVQKSPYTYYYRAAGDTIGMDMALFGSAVYVYSPADDAAAVAASAAGIDRRMFGREMSADRYAMLFKPGDYTAAGTVNVPFYVHIAGLGATPYEVRLHNVHTPPHLREGNGTCTFWRSAENFSVIGAPTYHEPETFKWAVSQAAPLRRVYSQRTVRYQWENGWVSGGFSADCYFEAPAGSEHQQQWFTRNSYLAAGRGEFAENRYNYCFQGVELGPDADRDSYIGAGKRDNVTFIESTPVIREKPFLCIGADGRYKVFRPALRHDAAGVSYSEGDPGAGEEIDLIDAFYIARPGVTAAELNAQLASGRNLMFTPGMYELEEPLRVERPGAIVMGLGWATLIPGRANSDTAVRVADVDGVSIASLLFDAHYSSASLLHVGADEPGAVRHEADPVVLSDLFFRIGGFRPDSVHVDSAVRLTANDVVGDHFWIWRADHGVRGSVGWNVNTADHGLVVDGAHVSVYGLFNEHFQKYQTLWRGEHGRMVFYQCETPYDAPEQAAFMSENGTRDGYAAYKVADNVRHHDASALGIYDVIVHDIRIENSMEAPDGEGIRITNLCNNSLSVPGPRGIGFLLNGRGKSTYNTFRDNLVRLPSNR